LDLYLIHRPAAMKRLLEAMEELYHQGKIKAIGVSNFEAPQLDDLIANAASNPPSINRNPRRFSGRQVTGILEATWRANWKPGAFCGRPSNGLFHHDTLATIERSTQTIAQVSLRWHFQEEYASPDPPRKRISAGKT